MDQLLAVVHRRQAFTAEDHRLKRQRNWLVELDRRLDPPEDGRPRPTPRVSRVRSRLPWFNWKCTPRVHPDEAKVVTHVCATFRQRWPRLFASYAWPEGCRTNNNLETVLGRLRTRQRQIHGRKSVHEFILRYGEWAVFIDPAETPEQVLSRLQQFDQTAFDQAYRQFQEAQRRLQVLYRFRHIA